MSSKAKKLSFIAALLIHTATWSSEGERPYCEVSTAIYEMNETTPLGINGQDLLNFVNRASQVVISYGYKPESTTATVTFEPQSEVFFDGSEAVYPPGWKEPISPICTDYIEIKGILTISSEDKAFDDSWIVTIRTSNAREIFEDSEDYARAGEFVQILEFSFDRDQLRGNFYDDASQQFNDWKFYGEVKSDGLSASIYHYESCSSLPIFLGERTLGAIITPFIK